MVDKTATTLVISDSCKTISDYAFSDCDSLRSVTIPDSVEYIGSSAFTGCTSLTSVTIPNSVTSIGKWAFSNCPIEYVSMPMDAIKHIPQSKLKEVVITSGTSIGEDAFYNCTSLTSVTIPDSVTSIGEDAFYYCCSLSSVNYLGTIEQWCGITYGGYCANPLHNGAKLYLNGEEVTNLVIPDTVTEIKACAFYGCTSLTSVTIPGSVTSIGEYAFYKCYKLVEVYNLSSLDITAGSSSNGLVGYYALDVYTSLDTPSKLSTDENGYIIYTDGQIKSLVGYVGDETELTLSSGITAIYKYAFYNCDSLTSVTIGNSVESIGDYAFYSCDSLSRVYYAGTVEEWNSITIGSYNTDLTGATRYYYSETEPTTSGNYWHYVDGVVTVW